MGSLAQLFLLLLGFITLGLGWGIDSVLWMQAIATLLIPHYGPAGALIADGLSKIITGGLMLMLIVKMHDMFRLLWKRFQRRLQKRRVNRHAAEVSERMPE